MFISCMMSTYNRRAHVPRAIRCFQEQTHSERELVIVDDGDDSISDLVPADPKIRHVRIYPVHRPTPDRLLAPGGKMPLRDKRQATFDSASRDADAFMFWDDDDWHGPDRIARQAAALATGAGACLLDPILFYELASARAWRWAARGKYRMCVGTLAFTRAYYDLVPGGFPPFGVTHSDQQFMRDRPWSEVVYASGDDCYVALRHGENSSGCNIAPIGPWSPAPAEEEFCRRAVRYVDRP